MCTGEVIILMDFVNTMHHNLKLTLENDDETRGVFSMNVRVNHVANKIKTFWYYKENRHWCGAQVQCQSPTIYKSGLVSIFVQSIYNNCSTWSNLHQGLKNAQAILRDNQYTRSSVEKEPVLPWIKTLVAAKLSKQPKMLTHKRP